MTKIEFIKLRMNKILTEKFKQNLSEFYKVF